MVTAIRSGVNPAGTLTHHASLWDLSSAFFFAGTVITTIGEATQKEVCMCVYDTTGDVNACICMVVCVCQRSPMNEQQLGLLFHRAFCTRNTGVAVVDDA